MFLILDSESEQGYFLKMLPKQEKPQDTKILGKKRNPERKGHIINLVSKDFSKKDNKPRLEQMNNHKHKEIKNKQMCQYWVNGACNKGAECTFSHDTPQIKKNELCKYFLTGNCFKDKNCLYSHETKNFPCKFFHAVGYCMQGNDCR